MKVNDNALETYFKKNDRKFVLDERSDCHGTSSDSCDGGTRSPSTAEASLPTQEMDQSKLYILIDRAFRRRDSKNQRESEYKDVPPHVGIQAKVRKTTLV